MSSIEKYDIYFSIRVTHEYYGNRDCPISLAPSQDTKSFFIQNQIIYKKMGRNKWVLLVQSEDFMPDITYILCFEIIPQDNLFYYVTGIPPEKEAGNYVLEKNPTIGKWMNILIPSDNVKKEVGIQLDAKLKYWEFIIIPRHTVNDVILRIEEKHNRLKFGYIEEAQLPGVGRAFRVSTIEKNKAKEIQEYTIRLYEIRNNGERLLSGNIPAPRPDEASVARPGDTVTTYFYI